MEFLGGTGQTDQAHESMRDYRYDQNQDNALPYWEVGEEGGHTLHLRTALSLHSALSD
jgi:hypothetical protein